MNFAQALCTNSLRYQHFYVLYICATASVYVRMYVCVFTDLHVHTCLTMHQECIFFFMYNVYTTQVEGVTIGFQDDLLVDGQALRW